MDRRARISMAALTSADLPLDPGVYALYRGDERMYVGKATMLRDRVWKNHAGRGAVMTGSAMRRNVADLLGIATANAIKTRRYQPNRAEVARVRAWLDGCEIAWVECATERAASELEEAMKAEFMPPLTKR